ncbi:nedd8-conjugating enzyme Ubc12 [Biomphalaria glabrata]|nr:nedd8-conjugating enzyme Ubc12-like [Biomphalaria glabrata]
MWNAVKELSKLTTNVYKLTIGQVVIEEIGDSTNLGDFHFYIAVTPKEGCYQGASYRFKVEVPSHYPFKAPYVNCLNKIYHPNIDIDDGGVCVSLLDRDWQPEVGLDGCIMAVLFLFYHPNVQDALSTAFDGGPMDETEFHNNVRASLKGEAIDGVLFDKLLDEDCNFTTEDSKPEYNTGSENTKTGEDRMKGITEYRHMSNNGSFRTNSAFMKNIQNTENLKSNINNVVMLKHDTNVNIESLQNSHNIDVMEYLNHAKGVAAVDENDTGRKHIRDINKNGSVTT